MVFSDFRNRTLVSTDICEWKWILSQPWLVFRARHRYLIGCLSGKGSPSIQNYTSVLNIFIYRPLSVSTTCICCEIERYTSERYTNIYTPLSCTPHFCRGTKCLFWPVQSEMCTSFLYTTHSISLSKAHGYTWKRTVLFIFIEL